MLLSLAKLNGEVRAVPRINPFQVRTSPHNATHETKSNTSFLSSSTMTALNRPLLPKYHCIPPSLSQACSLPFGYQYGPSYDSACTSLTTHLFATPRLAFHKLPAYYSTSYKKHTVVVPTIAESISSGVVFEIVKGPGSYVNADEVVLIIETEKIQVEVFSPYNGQIESILTKVGNTVEIGAELFVIQEGVAAPAASSSDAAINSKPTLQPDVSSKASPSTPPLLPSSSPLSSPASVKNEKLASSSHGPIERIDRRVRMTQARKRTAVRLKDSQNTAAMLTTFNEVDMQELMTLRQSYKDRFFERFGVKLGFVSVFAKASAIALLENPMLNATMDIEDIIYHDYVDISIAVSTPTSLVVPVLRNVEQMSLPQIESKIAEFARKAKENKLTIEDMSGGTFTISNGGVFGSLMGTPIINPPQCAILGMHAINKRPHVVNDKIEIRPMMYLALTYDHRLVDGREAVTALKRIKTLIEDPVSILLEL